MFELPDRHRAGKSRRSVDPARRARLRHDAFMEASQARLTLAMHSGNADEERIALRILDNPRDFSTWEQQHSGLMRQIVAAGSPTAEKCDLLTASLALIHRKALFEYLKSSGIRGEDRVRLMNNFFSMTDYSKAIVNEHGNYLRSAASYLCSSHVGFTVMLDDVFDEPLSQYEQLYGDYFRVYCGLAVATDRDEVQTLEPLASTLKREVSDFRAALISLAQSQSGVWRTPAELARRSQADKTRRFR